MRESEKKPSGHFVHSVAAASGWYLPFGQDWQKPKELMSAPNLPAGHAAQEAVDRHDPFIRLPENETG